MKPYQTFTLAAALATGLAGGALAQGTASSGATNNPQMTPPTAGSASASMQMPQTNASQTNATAQTNPASNVQAERVKAAQQKLQTAGLYKGPVDGRMDPDTRAALARFQEQNGLPRSERLDNQTYARLIGSETSGVGSTAPNATAAPSAGGNGSTSAEEMQSPQEQRQAFSGKRESRRNMRRSGVRQAQEQLRAKGLYNGRIDGIMGPKTRHAIVAFQRRNGLQRTAKLDRRTEGRLMRGGVGFGSSMPTRTHASMTTRHHQNNGTTSMMPPSNNPAPAAGAGGSAPSGNQTGSNRY